MLWNLLLKAAATGIGIATAKEAIDYGSQQLTGRSAFEAVAKANPELAPAMEQVETLGSAVKDKIVQTGQQFLQQDPAEVERLNEERAAASTPAAPETPAATSTAPDAPPSSESDEDGWLSWIHNLADEKFKNTTYDTIFKPMGIQRPTFDGYWETIEPTEITTTFTSLKAADLAMEKMGWDILDTKTAAIAAVAYTIIKNNDLFGQALSFLKQSGFMPDMGKFNEVAPQPAAQAPAVVAAAPAPAPGG